MRKYIESLKTLIQDKIGIGENRDKIDNLMLKISVMEQLVELAMPDVLSFEAYTIMRIEEKLSSIGINQPVSYRIHKSDSMFRVGLQSKGNVNDALMSYFTIGYLFARCFKECLNNYEVNPKRVLDFGSGHGRVSRYYPELFPSTEIYVSEIKKSAITFQKEEFGFYPIHHSENPMTFSPEVCFDGIFCLSVFTHLPKSLFEQWMRHIVAHLNSNGLFLFSIHDRNVHFQNRNEDFLFISLNEDTQLPFLADSLHDNENYGSTFVTESYLQDLFDKIAKGTLEKVPNPMQKENQHLYVFIKH